MRFKSAIKGLIETSVFIVTDDAKTNLKKFLSNTEKEMHHYDALFKASIQRQK